MAGPIFDSHAHYQSHQFDGDREALLQSLPAAGVTGVVECATDFATSKGALELAAIAPLLAEKKAVAVGEIGLDHHWPVPKDAQLELFEAQIRLALELDKPVIVHDREAHADTYALLKKYRPKGVLHCFSGSAEDAAWLTAQGMYIGFGGAATFKGAKRAVKAAAIVPPDKLLLETDCPYMAPEPCRGRRCDSSLIAHTAAFLAEVRGEETERLLETTCQNARALFGLG